jgi:hypothetical protein
MQDHVRDVNDHGCLGHEVVEYDVADIDKTPPSMRSIFSQLLVKAEPGGWVFALAVLGTMLLEYLRIDRIAPGVWPLISQSWFNTALVGIIFWLLSVYRDEDKHRSAKLKARAVGVFIWAGFGALLPGAFEQMFVIINWFFSGFGLK